MPTVKHWLQRIMRCMFCLLCVFTSFSAVGDVQGADALRIKRVLIISTGSRFAVGFPVVEQAAVEKIRQLDTGELEAHVESLDIVRFASESYQRVFRDYLRDKYADDIPDLIILIYVGNLGLAEKLLGQLFPATPVVAVGLTEEEFPVPPLPSRVTGMAQRSDPGGTLRLILRLQPETRRVVLIGGTAEVDRQVMSRAQEAARAFAAEVGFEVWDKRSMQEIMTAAASLPPQTAILFTRMFRDGAGRAINSTPAAQSIAKISSVPVYVMTDSMIGTGAVGGSAVDLQSLGRRAGEIAHRILSGAEPTSLPLEVITQGVPIFDWRALKRWGISENRLPQNSIVRFRPLSTWEQYRWYIIGALVVFLLQAALIAGLVLSRSRRHNAETELRQNQELMDMAAGAGGLGLWARDLKGDGIWANAVLRSLFGFGDNDRLRAGDLISRIHPDDSVQVMAEVERTQKADMKFEGEFRAQLPDGKERWLLAKGRGINEPNGRGVRRMGVVLDITDRKTMEEKLRESEEMVKKEHSFLRQVIDIDPNFVFAKDREGRFTLANQAVADAYGTTVENLVGKTDADFNSNNEEVENFRRLDLEVIDTQQERLIPEERITDAKGNVHWMQTVKRPIVMSNGAGVQVLGSATDITERKRAEEKFRMAVEASPNAIIMVNECGEIVLVNALTEKLFGYDRDELIGQSVEMLVPERFRFIHADHRAGFFAAPQRRAIGTVRDLFARRKNGSEFLVEIGLNPIETAEGVFVLTVIVDVTERKRAESELQRNREELAHVTRVSALGELAASLAHELNQPLTAILSNAQAAQRFLSVEPTNLDEIKDILKDIVEDNSRAGEIIRRMRALVKKEDLAFAALDIVGVVRDVIQLIHSDAILRNVRVSLEASPNLPSVRGDRVQLQQVVLNLLLNAFEAMKDTPAAEREVLVHVETDSTGTVQISVRDRGIGLTSDKADRIFQPFFTTKKDGLGMGLSISRSIVERHGGRLWAENNQDRGATFHVELPVLADAE